MSWHAVKFLPMKTIQKIAHIAPAFIVWSLVASQITEASAVKPKVYPKQPNILFVITDDQSWVHSSAYGSDWIETPAMERLAEGGVRFENAYVSSPSCSPSRAGVLTGRNVWQLQEGAVLWGRFPDQFPTYVEILEGLNYKTGFVGKGWGPGENFTWDNPSGESYNRTSRDAPESFFTRDYASDFIAFLSERDEGQPFAFWFGAHEPHRKFRHGAGYAHGFKPEDIDVPPFLPDTPEVRAELADYALEIEYFDQHLGRMIEHLEWIGELDNTLIVVTSDNGMPYPRAKMTCYEYGTRVPLIAHWPAQVPGGRVVSDFISLIDLAPTFLEAAEEAVPATVTGRSLMPILRSEASGQVREDWNWVVTGVERHGTWPAASERAIRVGDYLYVLHDQPEIPRPSLNTPIWQIVHALEPDHPLYALYAMRQGQMPHEELYNVVKDPACMNDLADDPDYAELKTELAARLDAILRAQNDPRAYGYGDIFNAYPVFHRTRFSGYHWEYIDPDWPIFDDNSWRRFGVPETYFQINQPAR